MSTVSSVNRRITPSGASEYRIDAKVVSAGDYQQALEKHNILIKARNFLVFQVVLVSFELMAGRCGGCCIAVAEGFDSSHRAD